jgi:DNA polymerase/3'-5' exonuclease PolX
MKKSEAQLQKALAESLHTKLTGLSDKSAKKLRKTVANAAKKIARKFTKLLAKEHKAGQVAASVLVPPKAAARRADKPVPRLATHKKARIAAANR